MFTPRNHPKPTGILGKFDISGKIDYAMERLLELAERNQKTLEEILEELKKGRR